MLVIMSRGINATADNGQDGQYLWNAAAAEETQMKKIVCRRKWFIGLVLIFLQGN